MPIVALAIGFMVGMALLGLFLAGAAALLVLTAVGAAAYGAYYLIKQSNETAKLKAQTDQMLLAQQLKEQEQTKFLTDQASKPFSSPKKFILDFARALKSAFEEEALNPPENITAELLRIAHVIYTKELPPPLPPNADQLTLQLAAQRAQNFDVGTITKALALAFRDFLALLPEFKRTQFTVPVAEVIDLPSATWGLVQPFRDTLLFSKGLCLSIWQTFESNCGDPPIMPQKFTNSDNWPNHKIAHHYLKNTPFNQLLQIHIPFGFDDKTRCTHHWCLGHNGTGKTTYLRYFIKADLERVERGECSLVVIDSKKLIREMRTLKQFSTTLKDRVIIVDREHPVALNPFFLPTDQSTEVVEYMLASLSDASDLQGGALTFLADAARTYPHPTLYLILDFLALKKDQLPDEIEQFDPDTQRWFRNTRPTLHIATSGGLNQRLANFLKRNKTLAAMFNADRCALDLFDQLNEGGKVLLVDTNGMGDEGTNLMGRLFIAMLDQLSERRTRLNEDTLKPIFCVLDEAQDYIKNDAKFARILEKARAQKVAMTVAHHHTGQIDPRIEQSLENAGIKTECKNLGGVTIRTRDRDYLIPIKPLAFDHPPQQMHPDEYRQMRERLDQQFGIKRTTPAEPDFQPTHDEP